MLRTEYIGLLSQIYRFIPDGTDWRGLIVHDEREDAECHRLATQLHAYYIASDAHITRRLVPEPFFVKSHLTLGILVADLIAYILAWGFRHSGVLTKTYRPDLIELSEEIRKLNGIPEEQPEDLDEYGIVYVGDPGIRKWR